MNIGPSPVVIPTNGPKESASTKVVPSDRPHSVGMSSAQGAGSIRVPAALSSLHLGPDLVILSTISGEEATRTRLQITASSASGNIASASQYTSRSRRTEPFNPFEPFLTLRSPLSSLQSKATGQEPGKPVTDPFPLPTLHSALSSL
jgi:hypothetical protein